MSLKENEDLSADLFDVVACPDIYDDVFCIAELAWDIERIR
jgi:hypothetical protein